MEPAGEQPAAAAAAKICMKCKERPGEIEERGSSAMCGACFTAVITRKIKRGLSRGGVKYGGSIVVAWSGGLNSSAVLWALQTNTLSISFRAVHVSEEVLLGRTPDAAAATRTSLERAAGELGCAVDVLCLSDVMDGENRDARVEALRTLMASLRTHTAREDMVELLRNQLLHRYMRAREQESLLAVGNTVTALAVRVVTAVCKGDAFSLPTLLSDADTTHRAYAILQPLSQLLAGEIAALVRLEHIPHADAPSYADTHAAVPSINTLTRKLMDDLQRSFLSTMSTVLRTARKLCVRTDERVSAHCPLCMHILSADEAAGRCVVPTVDVADVRGVCYACQLVLSECARPELLPSDVRAGEERVRTRLHHMSREEMEASLADFLL